MTPGGDSALTVQHGGDDLDSRFTRLETTVWGPFGTNGLKGEVARHSEQVGELFGRDEALREDLDRRLTGLSDQLHGKLDGIYKLMATLIVTIVVGAGGIIATLVVTR